MSAVRELGESDKMAESAHRRFEINSKIDETGNFVDADRHELLHRIQSGLGSSEERSALVKTVECEGQKVAFFGRREGSSC